MFNRPIFLVAIGIIIVAAAIGLNFQWFDGEEEPVKPVVEKQPSTPDVVSPAQTTIEPSFDIVRINPNGDTVIAGRAQPGAKVMIYDGDKLIGTTTADKRGEWVFLPDKPLPPGSRRLSLKSQLAASDPVQSKSDVVLIVPEKRKDIAGRSVGRGGSQPLALKIPHKGRGASTVLQKPSNTTDELKLAIDSVDYDDQGGLSVSGHSDSGATLRLYLDNKFIGQTKADGGGIWSLTPKENVIPGLYTLRVDQIADEGKVVRRASIPFVRSKPIPSIKPGEVIVVQPGNSLWRLARRTYGSGLQYTVIYEANKEQIKDPNLIYPGQYFRLPTSK